MASFENNSYKLHEEYYQKTVKLDKINAWKREDTVDAWRMKRILSNINPFLEKDRGAEWLTIGDGSYGSDARYIHLQGGKVIASDIADYYLKMAYEEKYIPGYSKENAEKLSFQDETFDYVLCSHAYHHFPRPSIALYEMLRVARKAVILLEPHDCLVTSSVLNAGNATRWFLRAVRNVLMRFAGKEGNYIISRYRPTGIGTYEESGNYEYYLSPREIEKQSLAINLPSIAFRYYNDYYIEGVEYETADKKSILFQKVKNEILRRNKFSRMGLQDYDQLSCVLFKTQSIAPELKHSMEELGYQIHALSRNPHI